MEEIVEKENSHRPPREKMSQKKFNEILKLHEEFLKSEGEDGTRAVIENFDLRGLNMRGVNLSFVLLYNVDLSGNDLSNLNLVYGDIRYSNLDGVNLENADMKAIQITHSTLNNGNLKNVDFSDEAFIFKSSFMKTNLENSELYTSVFSEVNMQGSNLKNAELYHTTLKNVNLLECENLTIKQLHGTEIVENHEVSKSTTTVLLPNYIDFNAPKKKMNQEDFNEMLELHEEFLKTHGKEGKRAIIESFDLRELDMYKKNLTGVYFYDVDLRGNDLSFANLENAIIKYSNLEGTNFKNANMIYIEIFNTNLKNVNFENTNINNGWSLYSNWDGVNFKNTSLKEADLSGLNLSNSKNLTNKQINEAITENRKSKLKTKLPTYLEKNQNQKPKLKI